MFNRRRLPLVVAGACLLLASGAAAAEPNAFTATSTPSHVKPATSASYTIKLTNKPSSPKEADKAKIGIPTDFVVDEATVQASAGAVGDCLASTWVADGVLVTGGKINVTRPGGGPNNWLCPGATLTVVFSATSASAEGEHTWTTELLRGEEAFLLNGSQPKVQVDGTAPTVAITGTPTNPSNNKSPSFTFTASEPAACKLDGGAFASCAATKGYSNLSEGQHTFTVQATDAAGNTGTDSYTWTIDSIAPTVAITGTPTNPSNNKSPSFTFTASEPAACKLDGGAFASCAATKGYSNLSEGQHTFTVQATDAAGNTGTDSYTWTIDSIAPDTTISSGPPTPTQQTSASFSFSSNELESTFQCSLDGAVFAACPGAPYTGLGDGPHTFRARATDPAGNTDPSPAIHTWTVDTAAPDTTINSGPPTPTNSTTASFTFSSEPGSTFQCSLDGAVFAACPTAPYAGLAEGQHTFRVRATDPAGNTDATPATHTWTIDLIGAATRILFAPPSSTNLTNASFTFESSEPATGTTFECSLDGALFTACSSPIAYSNLPDGPHTFAVRAVDPAKNTGPAAPHTWTIDSRPPTATVASGPAALSNSRSASFAFSADEPSSFQCSLDGGSFAPCNSPASYQNLGDGAHTFVARPTDAVGNTGASSSYSWTIDATAPETSLSSGPRSGTTTLSATFTFSASEPAAFQCKLDAAAFAPCGSPRSYSGLTRIGHSFEVRAIDAAGNPDPTPAVHRWTIAAAPRRVRTISALLAPRAGARVTSPPLLRWRRVPRASYYNVQLFRGSVKVLSAWPTGTRFQLKAKWTYLGRQRRLSAGTYRWYVWPGYGKASLRRYGRMLGGSTFRVVSRAHR